MPAGRPKYEVTEEVIKEVELLASRGLTEAQIATGLGISQQTLITKKKEYVEFFEAIKRGQMQGIEEIANALFNNATAENNTTAQIFYLKARAGWSDNNPDDTTDTSMDVEEI